MDRSRREDSRCHALGELPDATVLASRALAGTRMAGAHGPEIKDSVLTCSLVRAREIEPVL